MGASFILKGWCISSSSSDTGRCVVSSSELESSGNGFGCLLDIRLQKSVNKDFYKMDVESSGSRLYIYIKSAEECSPSSLVSSERFQFQQMCFTVSDLVQSVKKVHRCLIFVKET